ncbi:MAG: hypothetical protein HYX74_11970 [Acidobacteria bacterium]|nr:hypothetical protein [Acidobacteriota bacterium]
MKRGTAIQAATFFALLLLAVAGQAPGGDGLQVEGARNAEQARSRLATYDLQLATWLQRAGNAERARPAGGQSQQSGDPVGAVSLSLGSGASVVWDTDARGRPSEFIIRIAEFSPDRRFEWESRAQQGTIRIPARVLKEGKTFTFAKLFENGVDIDQADFLTLWLSEAIYQELKREGRSRVTIDALKDEFLLQETIPYTLKLDRQAVPVSALKVIDGRGATWLFLDSPENPVMLEFQNRYFHQKIRSMTTRGNILRWIRR